MKQREIVSQANGPYFTGSQMRTNSLQGVKASAIPLHCRPAVEFWDPAPGESWRGRKGGPSPKDGALSLHVGSSERNAHALTDVKLRREVVSVWGWAGGFVWSFDGDVGTVKL